MLQRAGDAEGRLAPARAGVALERRSAGDPRPDGPGPTTPAVPARPRKPARTRAHARRGRGLSAGGGARGQAYRDALDRGPAAYDDDPDGPPGRAHAAPPPDEGGGGGRVRLSAEVSAQLVAMNLRIDGMLRRLAPERAAEHEMRRTALMGDVMARGGTLTVRVVCGKGLPKMDRWGKSDPYVVLEVPSPA